MGDITPPMCLFPSGLAGPQEAQSPPGQLPTAKQTVSKFPSLKLNQIEPA